MALIELLSNSEIESKEPTSVTASFITDTIRSLLFSSSSAATGHESETDKKLKHISLDEVSDHDSFNDCWIIIYDRVYDITDFLDHVSWFVRIAAICPDTRRLSKLQGVFQILSVLTADKNNLMLQ